jgi:hypothetical protein
MHGCISAPCGDSTGGGIGHLLGHKQSTVSPYFWHESSTVRPICGRLKIWVYRGMQKLGAADQGSDQFNLMRRWISAEPDKETNRVSPRVNGKRSALCLHFPSVLEDLLFTHWAYYNPDAHTAESSTKRHMIERRCHAIRAMPCHARQYSWDISCTNSSSPLAE